MTRDYDEFLGRVFDHLSPALVALLLLVAAVAGGLLWYTYPAWLRIRLSLPKWKMSFPRWKWPRLRLPRWKRKRRPEKEPPVAKPEPPVDVSESDPEPPPIPATLSAADRLAAEGRYAEAIRERLRESVTTLTRYGVIAPAPAWTAHEVAATASANRPAVAAPLAGATGIFAEVWYGRRPAGPDQDALMRRLTAEVKAALETPR